MHAAPAWLYPRFVAHRGGGDVAPENTLAAMRAGVAHGYKMVEFDVKLSHDQIPVLMHDATLERTTNGHGEAGALDFGALARLDAGSWHGAAFAGEPVPTLTAIARYAQANGLACNVEIKPTPGLDALTGTLVARQARLDWLGAPLQPLLSSFSETALEAARQEAPELPRGLIAVHLPEDWLALLTRLGCVSIHLLHRELTRDQVARIQAAGFRVAVWTVNEPARAQELLDWGVDAVITDMIALMSPI